MTDEVEDFRKEFLAEVQHAECLCFAVRAVELQQQAVKDLKNLKEKARQLKGKIVANRLEDLANQMFSYENALQALSCELEMWVALKEDKADVAWDALVEAQTSARLALIAHNISGHLVGYLKRLKMLEILLFPAMQFLSVGVLVKKSTCSICAEEYGDCGHLKGKVYMGEICAREIVDAHLIETSFVDEPTNRHCRVMHFTEGGITRDVLTWRIVTTGSSNASCS